MQFDPTLWAQEITQKIRAEMDKLKTFNFGDVTEVSQKTNGGYQARVKVAGSSTASILLDCMTDYIPTVGDHVMIVYPKGSDPVIMGATPAIENTITAGADPAPHYHDDRYMRKDATNTTDQGQYFAGGINLFGMVETEINSAGAMYYQETNQEFRGHAGGGWGKFWHEKNFNPADYMPKTGGTFTGTLSVNGDLDTANIFLNANTGIYSEYLSGAYILRDHNNGNVTVSAAGGSLYLGYINTTSIIFNADLTNVGQITGKYGEMIRSKDEWLRLNGDNGHTSGIYCANSIFRTDGELQVGGNGATFRASSSYFTYKGDNILRGYSGTVKATYYNTTQLRGSISYSLTSGSSARVVATVRWVSGATSILKVKTVFAENVSTTGATLIVYVDPTYTFSSADYYYIDWIAIPDV